jgi:hypothetical protein
MNKSKEMTDKDAALTDVVQKHNLLMSKWEHQGALLSDMASMLDSLNDCDAPNALHAKVSICEKVIEIMNAIEP